MPPEAIADMPAAGVSPWRAAVNWISGVHAAVEAHYLWSPGTIAGNLTSFFMVRPCVAAWIRSEGR